MWRPKGAELSELTHSQQLLKKTESRRKYFRFNFSVTAHSASSETMKFASNQKCTKKKVQICTGLIHKI